LIELCAVINANAFIQVSQLSGEHRADLMLNKEARKWSAKVARDMRTIRSATKQINTLMDQIKAARVLPDDMFFYFVCAIVEIYLILLHSVMNVVYDSSLHLSMVTT